MARQSPAARSTLDIALWLNARSDSAGERLSPRRLHFLLYLAQALYAADHDGNKLIPATFLAAEAGPLEPNIYQLFAEGTPLTVPGKMNFAVETFLHEVWARFGRQSIAEVERFVSRDGAWSAALKEGRNSEITMELIVAAYEGTRALGSAPAREAAARSVSPGKEYWTMGGKRAAKWVPGVSGNPPARSRADEPPSGSPAAGAGGVRRIVPAANTKANKTPPRKGASARDPQTSQRGIAKQERGIAKQKPDRTR